jgi:hypothetical protein
VIYPNPVAGTTPVNLQMTLMKPVKRFTMMLYTTAYRKVNSWFAENLSAETYNTPLEIQDISGTPLANGVYFLVLNLDGERQVLKMMVLR